MSASRWRRAFRRFGSRVTVIEQAPQLVPREDPDVAEAVRAIFADDGIDVVLDAAIDAIDGRSGDRVRVRLRTPAGEREIDGSDLLVAAGRTPNTHGIGLESAGVELDLRGYVKVNERLETTASGVWAMGECAGSPQFTHVAYDDFRVVRDNLAGRPRTTRDRLIPYCMFIDPELRRVGLGEVEAKRRGISDPSGTPAHELGPSRPNHRRDTRFHEGAHRRAQRSHPRLHDAWRRRRRGERRRSRPPCSPAFQYTGLRDAILTHPTMAEGLGILLAGVPAMTETTRVHAVW